MTPEEQAYGILTYIYGYKNLNLYIKSLKVKLNKNKRIRYIYYNNNLIFTFRNNDGFLLPTPLAFNHIKNLYIIIDNKIVKYIKDGKSIPAKYINNFSRMLRPNMEVFAVDQRGELAAVGRLVYSTREFSLRRGYAVRPRSKVIS